MNFRWSAYNVAWAIVVVGALGGRFLRNQSNAVIYSYFAAIVAATLVLVVVGRLRGRHSKALESWAKTKGYQYERSLKGSPFRLSTFPFGQGGQVLTQDFVGARWGEQAQVFAFVLHYDKGSSQRHRQIEYQVIAMKLPRGLPTVQWIPLDTVSTAAVMVGGQKIDFESAEFNANWRVMGIEPRHVHDIVHPRLMERLNRSDVVGRPLVLEKDILFTWSAHRQEPDEYYAMWKMFWDVAISVPAFVWEDRSYAVSHSEE